MTFDFNRTLGQTAAKDSLSQALFSGKIPHALLLYGPPGLGQCALALDLADCITCTDPKLRPCGHCANCKARLNNPNLIHIFAFDSTVQKKADTRQEQGAKYLKALRESPYSYHPGDKEQISVDQIRELRHRMSFAESQQVRFVTIFFPEKMGNGAGNALLKLLEEPPLNTYFLLACEDKSSLLPTILSRCVKIALRPLSSKELLESKKLFTSAIPYRPEFVAISSGSPGVLLEFCRDASDTLLHEAFELVSLSLSGSWEEFDHWLQKSDAFETMDSSSLMLRLVLNICQCAQHAKQSKDQEDLSPELKQVIDKLLKLPDLGIYVGWLQDCLDAILAYAKPVNTIFGYYLELQGKLEARQEVLT